MVFLVLLNDSPLTFLVYTYVYTLLKYQLEHDMIFVGYVGYVMLQLRRLLSVEKIERWITTPVSSCGNTKVLPLPFLPPSGNPFLPFLPFLPALRNPFLPFQNGFHQHDSPH